MSEKSNLISLFRIDLGQFTASQDRMDEEVSHF